MKLRYYAAITTGLLTFFAAAAAMWLHTQRPIEDVIFIALLAYLIGAAAVLAATEPKKRRKHRARKMSSPKIITLDRKEWKYGNDR